MTPDRLAAIKARLAAATPGPWVAEGTKVWAEAPTEYRYEHAHGRRRKIADSVFHASDGGRWKQAEANAERTRGRTSRSSWRRSNGSRGKGASRGQRVEPLSRAAQRARETCVRFRPQDRG